MAETGVDLRAGIQPQTRVRNTQDSVTTTNQGREFRNVLEAQPIWAGLLAYSLQCFSNFAHPNCNIWDIQFNISIFNTSQILGIPIGYWNVSAYRPDPHGRQLKTSV